MEKRVIRTLAFITILTLAAVSVRADLVTDGGFETTGLPDWTLYNNTFQLAAAGMASGAPHGGTHVLQAYGPFVGNWDASGAYEKIAASPNETITLSGFCMNPSGDKLQVGGASFGAIQIIWLDASSATINTLQSTTVTATSPLDTWIPLSVSGTAPAGTAFVELEALHVNSPANEGGSVYFDDLSAVPEPSTVAMALTGLLGLVAFAKKRRV